MPKQIPEAVRQVIFRLVAEAFRNDRKLSLDDLYGKLLPNEFGLPLPVGRTKVWSLQKEALGEIKVPNALPDPSWSSSPAEWNPQAYPFLLALNRICLLGQAEGPPSNINVPERRELSAREADWGAKLYVALGGAPIGLSYRLISMFVNRDIVKEIYEYPIVIDDLVAYLAYKPWESSEASETYNLACRLGKIPSLGNMPLVAIDDEFEEPTWTTGVKSTAEITASKQSKLT